MDADLFLADLEEKPARLAALAQHLRATDPWAVLGEVDGPVVLLGMGSSHYAGQVAAARLRARGVPAVAELAATDLLPALRPGTLVVAVSASGSSGETLDAVRRLRAAGEGVRFVALTNAVSTGSTADGGSTGGELGSLCDVSVDLAAGEERGGVACRSFQHTLALLLALEARFTGSRLRSTVETARADRRGERAPARRTAPTGSRRCRRPRSGRRARTSSRRPGGSARPCSRR